MSELFFGNKSLTPRNCIDCFLVRKPYLRRKYTRRRLWLCVACPERYTTNVLTDCLTISFYHKTITDIIVKVKFLYFKWYFFPIVKLLYPGLNYHGTFSLNYRGEEEMLSFTINESTRVNLNPCFSELPHCTTGWQNDIYTELSWSN